MLTGLHWKVLVEWTRKAKHVGWVEHGQKNMASQSRLQVYLVYFNFFSRVHTELAFQVLCFCQLARVQETWVQQLIVIVLAFMDDFKKISLQVHDILSG